MLNTIRKEIKRIGVRRRLRTAKAEKEAMLSLCADGIFSTDNSIVQKMYREVKQKIHFLSEQLAQLK